MPGAMLSSPAFCMNIARAHAAEPAAAMRSPALPLMRGAHQPKVRPAFDTHQNLAQPTYPATAIATPKRTLRVSRISEAGAGLRPASPSPSSSSPSTAIPGCHRLHLSMREVAHSHLTVVNVGKISSVVTVVAECEDCGKSFN